VQVSGTDYFRSTYHLDAIGRIDTLVENVLGQTYKYAYRYDDAGRTYHFPPTLSNILYKFLFTIAQLFMCLFYATSLTKISQTAFGKRIFNILKPVGRMALTNYPLQTLICIFLFYNFGLDLVAELGFDNML